MLLVGPAFGFEQGALFWCEKLGFVALGLVVLGWLQGKVPWVLEAVLLKPLSVFLTLRGHKAPLCKSEMASASVCLQP